MCKPRNIKFIKLDIDWLKSKPIRRLLSTHGDSGIGLYIVLLTLLEEQEYTLPLSESDYKSIAREFSCPASLVRSVVKDFGLFEPENVSPASQD